MMASAVSTCRTLLTTKSVIGSLTPCGPILREFLDPTSSTSKVSGHPLNIDSLISRPLNTVFRGPAGVGKSCILAQIHDVFRERVANPVSLYVPSLLQLVDGSLPYCRQKDQPNTARKGECPPFDVPGFSLYVMELLRAQNQGTGLTAFEARRLRYSVDLQGSAGPMLHAGTDTVGSLFSAAVGIEPKEQHGLATRVMQSLLRELMTIGSEHELNDQVIGSKINFTGVFIDSVNALYMKTAYFNEDSERLMARSIWPAWILRLILEGNSKKYSGIVLGAESQSVADEVGLTLKGIRFVGCSVKRLERMRRAKAMIGPIEAEPYPDSVQVEQVPSFSMTEIESIQDLYLNGAKKFMIEPINLHRIRLITAGNGKKIYDLCRNPDPL